MSAQSANLPRVDLTALRVNQASIITLLILAFILNLEWLVPIVGIVMGVGTLLGVPGFKPLYQYVLKPAKLAKPDVIPDNPEPHRFAQGLGSFFLILASLALFADQSVIGWGLSWLVTALAAVNLFLGFCVGCFVYYWLNRLGIPGFTKSAPPNTIPGMRPRTES